MRWALAAATWWCAAHGALGDAVGASGDVGALEALQAQVTRCKEMMRPLKAGAKVLQSGLAQCERSLADAKKEVKHVQEVAHLEKNELEDLRVRNRDVEDGVSDKDLLIQQLRRKNEVLETNVTQLVKLGQGFRGKTKKLEVEVETALGHLEYERSILEEKSREISKLEKTIALLKSQLEGYEKGDLGVRNEELSNAKIKLEMELAAARGECKDGLAQAEKDRSALASEKEENAALAKALEEKSAIYDDLAHAHGELETKMEVEEEKRSELSTKIEELDAELSRTKEQLSEVDHAKLTVEERAEELARKKKQADEESERLKELFESYKNKVDDPALVDYFVKKAEWLKHPKVEGVDTAYEKTLKLLGPKLNPTHAAMLEMQAMLQSSTEKLRSAAPEKYSPILNGILTYGIILVPMVITACLLIRLRNCIPLTKAVMLMVVYNMVFCVTLAVLSFVVESGEPMIAFRNRNREAFEFVQILLPVYYIIYLFSHFLIILKYVIALRCKCSVRLFVMFIAPIFVMYHYYLTIWLPTMRDQVPEVVKFMWLGYSVVFALLFSGITCWPPVQPASGSPLLPSGNRHGHALAKNKDLEAGGDHMVDVNADVLSPEDVIATAAMVKDTAEALIKGKKRSSSKKKKDKSSSKTKSPSSSSPDDNKVD
mmetsp:Transcript_4192/g.7348  ORF Transcript_4192/g.7348 Transcript_4192/m.7348 type:complete len:659 (+) Transcript_4192:117-2093(+)